LLVAKACVNFASLEVKGEEFLEKQKIEYENLNPETFAKVLIKRLSDNLKKREANVNHYEWRFIKHNAELGAAILKLHGCPLNDESLERSTSSGSIFSNAYLMSLECLSGRKHSILDDIDDQVGAYMYQDEQGLGIIRAGSAAVGLRRRHNGHVKASKQANTTELSSQFYSAYPDQGSKKKGTRGGNFQQLRQVTGVRFKKDMIPRVVEMFSWERRVLQRLEEKKLAGAPTLVEKQHRMVCYFFEKLFDVMIDPNVNLSQNAGFESFVGNWNRAQDN
jgi:hypothetical protein